MEEADAIEKTMLRAEMLPEPQRGNSLGLLREYLTLRHDLASQTLSNQPQLDRVIQRTKSLHEEMWQQAVVVTQQSQTAVVASYIQALNETIGVAEKRLAAFENRVPKSVWIIILLVAAFQSFVTGYSLKRQFWLSIVVTPLVVALVIALIADLDSPHSGLIQIEQKSMDRLVQDVSNRNP